MAKFFFGCFLILSHCCVYFLGRNEVAVESGTDDETASFPFLDHKRKIPSHKTNSESETTQTSFGSTESFKPTPKAADPVTTEPEVDRSISSETELESPAMEDGYYSESMDGTPVKHEEDVVEP